jgi:hypothetical protein
MRLWWIRIKGMEINMINKIREMICLYKERQVVLNVYEKEELVMRYGFDFDVIQVIEDRIDFLIKGKRIHSINLIDYHEFDLLKDYRNYFILMIDRQSWLELYFP